MAIPLTPEQKEYKRLTLNQLLINLPQLETQLAQEQPPDAVNRLRKELEEVQAHIDLLQEELDENTSINPVADELFKQAASALVKEKFFMARRYIIKLETIEPFYPELPRLKRDAEAEQASRRIRSMLQSEVMPSSRPLLPAHALQSVLAGSAADMATPALPLDRLPADEPEERGGIRQFFQLHIVLSCLVILLIGCVMAGVGGVSLLEWIIEGL
jgi:hypothetical protein